MSDETKTPETKTPETQEEVRFQITKRVSSRPIEIEIDEEVLKTVGTVEVFRQKRLRDDGAWTREFVTACITMGKRKLWVRANQLAILEEVLGEAVLDINEELHQLREENEAWRQKNEPSPEAKL
jgi:hypothetical protein